MMRRRLAGLALVLIGLPAVAPTGLPAFADDADPLAATVESVRTDAWPYAFLERLTTEIGPRLAGSDRMAAAVEWAEREMKAAGLENVHREPFVLSEWRRGSEEASVIAPVPQRLAVLGLGGGVATPPGGIDAEIVPFRRYADLIAAKPGSLAGKIAVVTERMARTPDGNGYEEAIARRVEGPSEAAARGAVAYLLRSVGTDSHRLPHTGVTEYRADAPKIPAAALSNPDADLIERLVGRGPVKLHVLLTPSLRENVTSWNVVGEVKGGERAQEQVVIGGHLDSWDPGTGAIDDGAGLAIATSAARAIAHRGTKPRRTLRLVYFGAEERGFSGPAFFKAHESEQKSIVLAGEADLGADRVWLAELPAGAPAAAWGKRAALLLHPLGIGVSPAPAGFGGADFEPWQNGGTPLLNLQQDASRYFDLHHTADDTLDKVEPEQIQQAAAAWTAVIGAALDAKDLDR